MKNAVVFTPLHMDTFASSGFVESGRGRTMTATQEEREQERWKRRGNGERQEEQLLQMGGPK